MSYTKNNWVDQKVERPKTYQMTKNPNGTVTLVESFGLVEELGTPVNAVNMNHIEDGIEACAIRKHSLSETFEDKEWVVGVVDDKKSLFESLKPDNLGNSLSDDLSWKKVELGGGSAFNLFDLVQKDHILTFEESEGLEPLGNYAYKEGVAGSRYGYPDFYNKCLEEFMNANNVKEVLQNNVNIIGTLTNKNGVLSGFNTNNNYATLKTAFKHGGKPWEIVFKVTTGSDLASAANSITGSSSSSLNYHLPNIQLYQGGFLALYLSSDGTHWDIADGDKGITELQINTTYYVKVEYTGSEYNGYISTNGVDYTREIHVEDSTPLYQSGSLLGIGANIWNTGYTVWGGSIDLKESYINIDGNRFWDGADCVVVNPNGHKFFDIKDKSEIDKIYEETGSAWYYGVDRENKRIFLPRKKDAENSTFSVDWSKKVSKSTTTVYTAESDGFITAYLASPSTNSNGNVVCNINGETVYNGRYHGGSGAYYGESFTLPISKGDTYQVTGAITNFWFLPSNIVVNTSSVYLYICVGNTKQLTHITTTVPEGGIIEQVYKNKGDIVDLKDEIPIISAHSAMPSNRYIDLELGAVNSTYTAPSDGYFLLQKKSGTNNAEFICLVSSVSSYVMVAKTAQTCQVFIPIRKNNTVRVDYSFSGVTQIFRFIYAEGAK